MMSPKEHVISALSGEQLDMPPVAVFTQSATCGQMEYSSIYWPDANYDAGMMASLASCQADMFGFEAVRAPFCLTVEAERLGCRTDRGSMKSTPMVVGHPWETDPADACDIPDIMSADEFLRGGRPAVVADAIGKLSKTHGSEYPIVAGVTGPMTIAGHMISVERLILGTMLMPEWVKSVVKSIVPICKAYSQTLSDAGADVIQMSEGLASPDMILPDNFMEFSGDFLNDCLVSVKGAFSSLHICGDTTHILEKMASLGVDALSIEEKVNPAYAVNVVKGRAALVGNIGVVSPLMQGTPKDCVAAAEKTMSAGFDIIAPGCGLSYGVSNENLEAVIYAVKGRR